jgi:hypothetical protein
MKINKKVRKKPNLKVIMYSLIGLICIALMFFVSWYFIIGAAIVIWLNQRELVGKKN